MVFWKELNKCFLYFFLKSLFFAMLGILSTPPFCWLNWTALCNLSKKCPLLITILTLKRYLKNVYRQSTCWYLKQNEFCFCSKALMLPIRIMWYLQLGSKHILSSWRTLQCSLLTKYFSYVFAGIKRLFLNTLYKNWESLVTLQLPSDCCVVFRTNETNKILL